MAFMQNWLSKAGGWLQKISLINRLFSPTAASPSPGDRITLGDLLPTLGREYFASMTELPIGTGRELNLATAWWCAEASMLAYQKAEEITKLAEPAVTGGWEVMIFGAGGPIFAVLLKSPDAAILAFRGTRVSGFERLDVVFTRPWLDYDDLKADATFVPAVHLLGGKVHGGIQARFQRFWEIHGLAITSAIGTLPLYLTGHSLGAALATIMAASGILKSAVALYSFGSPRVGDAIFGRLVTAQDVAVHRFVHGNDLVTTLAPEGVFGYAHVGRALHIKRDGTAIDDVETTLAGVLIDGLPSVVESVRNAILNLSDLRLLTPTRLVVPRDALADHAPIFYVDRIQALARSMSGRL